VWSFEAETRRWPSGWNVKAQTFESCAWESVARGGICGAGAENVADAVCDADEVPPAVDDDGTVGKIGPGVLAVGEERSQ
jgi:hypothetical protein